MKVLVRRPKVAGFFVGLGIVSNLLLWVWGISHWLDSFKVFWILLIPAVLIFIFPPTQKKSENNLESSCFIPIPVIARIVGLQFFLAVLLEIGYQVLQINLFMLSSQITFPAERFFPPYWLTPLPLSILPWLGVGLFVCGFKYVKESQTTLRLSTLLHPKHRKDTNDSFNLFVNVLAKLSTQCVLALSLMSLVLLTLYVCSHAYFHRILGIGWHNILFWVVFLIIVLGPFIKAVMNRWFKGNKWNLPIVFISSLIFLLVILFFCLALFSIPSTSTPFSFVSYVAKFASSQSNLTLFAMLWQLGWMPIIAMSVTQVSEKISSRSLLLVLTIGAYLVQLLMIWLTPVLQVFPWVGCFFGIVSWMSVAWLFSKPKNLTWLVQVSVPGENDKNRPFQPYLIKLLKLTGYLIFLTSMIGLWGLNFLFLPLFAFVGLLALWFAFFISWKLVTTRRFTV